MARYDVVRHIAGRVRAVVGLGAAAFLLSLAAAQAADPIKVGLSLSLTGATAPAGRQVQAGLEIWRDMSTRAAGCSGVRSSSSTMTIRPTRPMRPASTPS